MNRTISRPSTRSAAVDTSRGREMPATTPSRAIMAATASWSGAMPSTVIAGGVPPSGASALAPSAGAVPGSVVRATSHTPAGSTVATSRIRRSQSVRPVTSEMIAPRRASCSRRAASSWRKSASSARSTARRASASATRSASRSASWRASWPAYPSPPSTARAPATARMPAARPPGSGPGRRRRRRPRGASGRRLTALTVPPARRGPGRGRRRPGWRWPGRGTRRRRSAAGGRPRAPARRARR